MINWQPLRTEADLTALVQASYAGPCLIFKHSTTCPISSMAKYRLEDDWKFDDQSITPYYLDLLRHRSLSNLIAETFSVHHESPQVILVSQGESDYDSSHLDISVPEVEEQLARLAK